MLLLSKRILFIAFVTLLIVTCKQEKKNNTLFSKLSSDESGISFSNDITETDTSHSFINEFGYMGGGVGIGDFNNDGLKDIFFSGNQVSSRAYINKGNNKFEDITEKAGLTTHDWATGVSIVDINNDGFDDIYLCVFGKNLVTRSKNLLFINQHDLTFKEQAADYGLADTSFSTQAAFLDYDRDGDLDMYLANYLLADLYANAIFPRDKSGRSRANDRLYRNDGDSLHKGHPVFTDVSFAANIREDGYGLGVSVSDFNNDGWPDIYVANDFVSNDLLWLNNHDGTFTNCIDRSIRHQSYSSMGSDAADLNNDGWTDIVTLDMLPETNERKKTSFFFMNNERYEAERSIGYEPEFPRNMLQLNNGCYSSGDTSIPFFSEIGHLAGISATDWSWSVLLADFNNDGLKDIHVTNGIGRDFINADFLEFSRNIFSNTQNKETQRQAIREKLASLEHVTLPNYLYFNKGGYEFADVSGQAGINELSMSNGAAHADLDNDGDLDIVVNNINKQAFIYINNTRGKTGNDSLHYISIKLGGDSLNTKAFGAKLTLYCNGKVQVQEQYPVRGYFSSVDQQLFFGLDTCSRADSLLITWPGGKQQVVRQPAIDTMLVFSQQDAVDIAAQSIATSSRLFTDITSASGALYRHKDVSFNDFGIQRLLPQKYSQLGPFIATGDINNDGLIDFFAGGGFNSQGKLFFQNKEAKLASKDLSDSIKMEEDMDCLFFDADSDGDNDLLVTSGDIRYEDGSDHYKPRLYINDGKGNFNLQANAFPPDVKTIAGCVTTGDYDGDNDPDLFIGGRVSRKYPVSPKSFILRNNKGIFTDVTDKVHPGLKEPGMITSAIWTDYNNDRHIDLVIAGEWMPVRFFKNSGPGKNVLTEETVATGLSGNNGMWRKLVADDIDNDGDIDIIAGNLGLNCIYKASSTEPMKLMATDIDGNGTIDPVFFYYIKDKDGKRRLFPGISRSQFAEQVPSIKKQFLRYSDYAKAEPKDIFKSKSSEDILELTCEETRTCYFENLGNGKFRKHILPVAAQFAPVNAIICADLDNDGSKDLLLAGNEYQAEVMTGRYDASYGCFLKGNKTMQFNAISPVQSGFVLRGDTRDLDLIKTSTGQQLVLATVNNDSLRIFTIKN